MIVIINIIIIIIIMVIVFFLERHAVAGQMQKSEDCDGRAASSLGLAQ